MAFAAMLRRSTASAAPLARRLIGRNHHSSAIPLFSAAKYGVGASASRQQFLRSSFPPVLNYSTAVEAKKSEDVLLRVIESEIGCAEIPADVAIPANFPFKIQDNQGEYTVTLTRQFEGETITVQVYMPDLVTGEEEDDDDDDKEEEAQQSSSIPFVVKVSKGSGPSLEFGCTGDADQILIDSLSVKNPDSSNEDIAYEGPDFGDLDENLQKAFHKYLSVRGITPLAINFLHEYMIEKDHREYQQWLKNLKKFVAA